MLPVYAQLVLIHGLSVPSMIWQDVAPELAAKGYRVLVYGASPHHRTTSAHSLACLSPPPDLYGRGYSDAPQATYDVSLYVTQLALLLQYVGWDKADLAGISMVRRALGPPMSSPYPRSPHTWHRPYTY